MDNFGRPLPKPTATSAPFWEAAHCGELKLQYCTHCQAFQHYPRTLCANCWNDDIEWRHCSGRGHVHSFSICNVHGLPSVTEDAPNIVAIIELQEGVRMTTNIVRCAPGDVAIGMEVEAEFQPVSDDYTLITFRPTRAHEPA
jgi:uncharacterized OB-fold protein